MLKAVSHAGLAESFNKAIRTEDVRFSPSGRVLALVATNGGIYLFAVDTASRPIRIIQAASLRSTSMSVPHGIDFLSEDLVAVANRGGWVTFYRIPGVETWRETMTVEPIHEMQSVWFGEKGAKREVEGRKVHCGPGSVRVTGNRLIVCCNNQGTVSEHPFQLRDGTVETGEGTVIGRIKIEIPDGVAFSRDGRWMAVADHQNGRVVICRGADGSLACLLDDVDLNHPHGLCFDSTGQVLYVADAGRDYLHVFVSRTGWDASMDRSAFRIPAVEEEAFRKTKESVPEAVRSLEGGVKGLDVDAAGRIVVTTCQNQMLRFFEAEPFDGETWRGAPTSDRESGSLCGAGR